MRLIFVAALIKISGVVPDYGAKVENGQIITQPGTELIVDVQGQNVTIKAL